MATLRGRGNLGENAQSWGFPPRAASEQASLLVHGWEVGGMEEPVPKRNRKERHFYKYFYVSFSNLLPFRILKPLS